jgi:hypothetical protein
MKKIKVLIASLLFIMVCTSSTHQTTTVWICVSPAAVAYHIDKECQGLAKCTHPVISVSKQDAINKYGRRACRFCCHSN